MAEALRKAPAEHQELLLEPAETHELLTEHAEGSSKEAALKHSAERLESLVEAREQASTEAVVARTTERLKAAAEASPGPSVPQTINRELKAITLRRELQMIRRKLPAPQRAFSKIVHQPVVRAISETASKTISRPSGLLGGGLVAFFGTSIYYYLAQHIGFTYNGFLFILLFVGGFVVGVALEFLIHLAIRSRNQAE